MHKQNKYCSAFISIHAPLRGATCTQASISDAGMLFQSTPLCEGRHALAYIDTPRGISIHAPLRGATTDPTTKGVTDSISIHAPLRGATHPPHKKADHYTDFNPRPSARGDFYLRYSRSAPKKFQSTPLCEGRHVPLDLLHKLQAFQSTPLCEGRPWTDHPAYTSGTQFQSTPLCEGRPLRPVTVHTVCKFQSTPLCEGRRIGSMAPNRRRYFNPRPSARGDR